MRISDWSSDVCSSDLLGVALIHLHCESIVHFHRRRLYSHHLKGTSLGQLSHEVLWLYILSESERRDLAAKLVQPHPPAKCAPSRICHQFVLSSDAAFVRRRDLRRYHGEKLRNRSQVARRPMHLAARLMEL